MHSDFDHVSTLDSPKVLVIGATGFIGAPLVRHLEAMNATVYAMHRGLTAEVQLGEEVVCDREDSVRLSNLARLERFDVVIDLLAMTVRQTLPVLYALSGRIKRYILISSADVYRNYEGLHRKASPDHIETLDEDAPLRTTRYPYKAADGSPLIKRFPADYDKIPIEGAVRAQTGFEWTILRLPMVYGPGDRQRRFAGLIRRMAEGRPVLPMERSWASWYTTFGYVENVAQAIARVSLTPTGAGKTVNIGPDSAVSMAGIARALGRTMDWHGEILVTDDPGMPDHLAQFARNHDFSYSLRLDTTRLWSEFQHRDDYSLDRALRVTAADERELPRPANLDEEYAEEDAWLEAQRQRGR